MVAYVITDLQVTDLEGFQEYKKLAGAAVAEYGGKFLARGGHVETLDGLWPAERVVIIEFESVAQAKAWQASEGYQKARVVREKTAQARMIVVEGS